MEDAFYLQQSFSERIGSNLVVIPGNWHWDSEDKDGRPATPNRNALSDWNTVIADAKRRWEKGPEAALEPLFSCYEMLTSHPCFKHITPLVQYASAFYKATGPDFEDAQFQRWNRAVDAGLLDFCERVVSTDDVLSQIYQVRI